MPLSRDTLVSYMKEKLGVDTDSLADDAQLFSNGTLDSFSMVELITFIENEASIRLAPTEVSLDNLDSIERILAFVQTKAES